MLQSILSYLHISFVYSFDERAKNFQIIVRPTRTIKIAKKSNNDFSEMEKRRIKAIILAASMGFCVQTTTIKTGPCSSSCVSSEETMIQTLRRLVKWKKKNN